MCRRAGSTASATTAAPRASFLILFAPGIARERFFIELARMREQGVELTEEERVAFYARHDQVNLE